MAAEAEIDMVMGAFSPPGFGPMGESPFDEQARRGFEQYSQPFGSPRAGRDDEGKEFSKQEKERRDRAKKANKIYRRVCEDVGLKACFFSNFGDWAEYVEGKISDTQFRMNTEERARQMMADN